MRQFLFGALLLGGIPVVRAVNDFQPIFSTDTKRDEEEVKWINFSDTDLKSMSLVAVSTKNRIPLTLEKCAESGKTQKTCKRWINTGKFKYEGDLASVLLTSGSSYYFELEYVDKATGIKTGTSKSTNFLVQNSKSPSGSSSSKSKKKKGKGKLGAGGIAGIAIVVAVLLIVIIGYAIWALYFKSNDKGTTSKELGEVELGKQADPLMGQDESAANKAVWSADVPDNHTGLPIYEPYKATTDVWKGAAADYQNDQPVQPVQPVISNVSGNGAGPMGHDRY